MYIEKYFLGRKWLNITFELEFFVEPVQKKLDHSPKKISPSNLTRSLNELKP